VSGALITRHVRRGPAGLFGTFICLFRRTFVCSSISAAVLANQVPRTISRGGGTRFLRRSGYLSSNVESDPRQNGIYNAASGAWTLAISPFLLHPDVAIAPGTIPMGSVN
jgi:hypothetical protein